MGFFDWLFGRKNVLRLPEDWIKAADEQEAKGLPDIEVIGRPSSFRRVPDYELGVRNEQKFIKCLKCQMTSFSQGDITHLYCSNCKVFHARRKFDTYA